MLIDTKSSLNLGIINWKNNKYEMFYDLNINFFYWFQIVNNYKFKTKKEDNIQLNLALNNMSTVLHENKQSNLEINRKNLFIKRFINFGKKTICILIASGLCLTTISNAKVLNDVIFKSPKEIMNMKQDFEEQLKTEYYTYRHLHNKDEYNYNNLKECIKNNKNLTEPEKSFISNLKFFFDENHEYMDMRLVESRLSNLKIIYNDNENSNVHGEYNFESNTITIYNAKNFENCKYLDNNYKEYINNLTKLLLKKTNMDKNVNIEDIYIIPKTYMSDESKNALIIFKPINKIESKTDYKPIEIEINDKFCEEYSKMVENTRDIDIVN